MGDADGIAFGVAVGTAARERLEGATASADVGTADESGTAEGIAAGGINFEVDERLSANSQHTAMVESLLPGLDSMQNIPSV
jgi:hypothetical protein